MRATWALAAGVLLLADCKLIDQETFPEGEHEPRPAVWGGWWRVHGGIVRAWRIQALTPMSGR